ncbi:MAG: zinc metallopeptidase [Lachnospiraceae bacterium]|nr:zinc metallopeptidase [Lachnospiraceae bacterium]
MMYGYYFDSTYLLILLGLVITLIAQAKMKSTYARYSQVDSLRGLTGAEAARKILLINGVYDVVVQPVSGTLTDHYDPSKKVVNLSEAVYGKTSLAAIGVAAHECGHALQDSEEYIPLKARTALVPAANFGSGVSWYLILAGVLLGGNLSILTEIGIVLFAVAVGFQLVTLPVEFNASSRALTQLTDSGMIDSEERKQVKSVLTAAALTYVAAAASGILQLLRLIILFGGNGRRRR